MKMIRMMMIMMCTAGSMSAFAQGSSSLARQSWNSGADYEFETQITTVSISPGTTFGPTFFNRWDEVNRVGVRISAPLSRNESFTVMSVGGVWRHLYSEASTSLFTDVALDADFFGEGNALGPSSSPGLEGSMGLLHMVTRDLAFGGSAGVKVSQMDVSSEGFSKASSTTYIYPRIAVFGNYAF